MVTPFASDGSVDLPRRAQLAEHLVTAMAPMVLGVAGPRVNRPPQLATEAASTRASRQRAVRLIGPMLTAGTGSNCTSESGGRRIRPRAQAHGADGGGWWWFLITTSPPPGRPRSPISGRSATGRRQPLAVMLYKSPGRTGLQPGAETAARLMDRPTWSASRRPSAAPMSEPACAKALRAPSWRLTAVMTPSPCRCWPSGAVGVVPSVAQPSGRAPKNPSR